jgi:hypothetical protein
VSQITIALVVGNYDDEIGFFKRFFLTPCWRELVARVQDIEHSQTLQNRPFTSVLKFQSRYYNKTLAGRSISYNPSNTTWNNVCQVVGPLRLSYD